eukprot:CAMPEP_0181288526 /NCGR_PEP_ID=MMETSP1101-20121128/381_1 /TAXON_ID=46948 /ORGANISM="Rhodomonas abbreviata, Strain Caron Lab Isolate" /LENGTH=352 /DNA_ID=CAMNT_0023392657 /DNA_START=187 /DNA_END=1246 /DNA_ORIENTATION=-
MATLFSNPSTFPAQQPTLTGDNLQALGMLGQMNELLQLQNSLKPENPLPLGILLPLESGLGQVNQLNLFNANAFENMFQPGVTGPLSQIQMRDQTNRLLLQSYDFVAALRAQLSTCSGPNQCESPQSSMIVCPIVQPLVNEASMSTLFCKDSGNSVVAGSEFLAPVLPMSVLSSLGCNVGEKRKFSRDDEKEDESKVRRVTDPTISTHAQPTSPSAASEPGSSAPAVQSPACWPTTHPKGRGPKIASTTDSAAIVRIAEGQGSASTCGSGRFVSSVAARAFASTSDSEAGARNAEEARSASTRGAAVCVRIAEEVRSVCISGSGACARTAEEARFASTSGGRNNARSVLSLS